MTARDLGFGQLRSAGLVGLVMLVTTAMTLLAPPTLAGVRTGSSGPGVDPDPQPRSGMRARALLDRVAEADETVKYRGTQFVVAWNAAGTSTTMVEVKNVPGERTMMRTSGGVDGPARTVFTAASGETSLQVGGGPVELLARSYSIQRAGTDSVAGREARVLEMYGAQDLLAARMWIDADSGLLLRREVYDRAGRTVRASAFVEVRIKKAGPRGHLPPMQSTSQPGDLGADELRDLRRAGCVCPDEIAGHLRLYLARIFDTDAGPVLHLSYSDGLSTVSVFEQNGRVDEGGLAGYSQVRYAGASRYVPDEFPNHVLWSARGIVYYVVADAPPEILDGVLEALPREEREPDGVTDRIGRGLARVGSWVNPFA